MIMLRTLSNEVKDNFKADYWGGITIKLSDDDIVLLNSGHTLATEVYGEYHVFIEKE